MTCDYCTTEFVDGELAMPLREITNERASTVNSYVHMTCAFWMMQGKK